MENARLRVSRPKRAWQDRRQHGTILVLGRSTGSAIAIRLAASAGRPGAIMEEHQRLKRRPWPRTLRWFSRRDVLMAFRVVGQEIRGKCRSFTPETVTLAEACELARRIKDQRDLIQQLADRRNRRHARRLLRLNKRLRVRFLRLAEEAGLDTSVLLFR